MKHFFVVKKLGKHFTNSDNYLNDYRNDLVLQFIETIAIEIEGSISNQMNLSVIKSICLSCLALLIIFYPLKTDAMSHDWVAVPKSQYGEQLWDKNSVLKNQDGSIRVLSKFIPKSSPEITQEILYTMDIDCSKKSFRDVAVGTKEFNEFKNNDSEWKGPNGDNLIRGVINQVCAY